MRKVIGLGLGLGRGPGPGVARRGRAVQRGLLAGRDAADVLHKLTERALLGGPACLVDAERLAVRYDGRREHDVTVLLHKLVFVPVPQQARPRGTLHAAPHDHGPAQADVLRLELGRRHLLNDVDAAVGAAARAPGLAAVEVGPAAAGSLARPRILGHRVTRRRWPPRVVLPRREAHLHGLLPEGGREGLPRPPLHAPDLRRRSAPPVALRRVEPVRDQGLDQLDPAVDGCDVDRRQRRLVGLLGREHHLHQLQVAQLGRRVDGAEHGELFFPLARPPLGAGVALDGLVDHPLVPQAPGHERVGKLCRGGQAGRLVLELGHAARLADPPQCVGAVGGDDAPADPP